MAGFALPAFIAKPVEWLAWWFEGFLGAAFATLSSAVVMSAIVHTTIIFGVGIKAANPELFHSAQPLEVVLVNARSKTRPLEADVLAQANLDGGGEVEEERQAKSPLLASERNAQAATDTLESQVKTLEEKTRQLMTQAKSTYGINQEHSEAPAPDKPTAPAPGQDALISVKIKNNGYLPIRTSTGVSEVDYDQTGPDDREFVAGLRFDLRSITAGTEVAEAALVLTGLDDALKRDVGEWYVELVDFTRAEALDAVSFAQLVGAPSAPGDCTWRLRAADLSPGARNVLAFGDDARRALASRVTTGEALFRIDGPVGVTNAFAWHARGADGPRLRIEFAAAHDGATTQATPLVVWEPTP